MQLINGNTPATDIRLKELEEARHVFHVDLLMPYKETEQYGTPYT